MSTLKTVQINITGIVQGIGFRPFLFNLAKEFGLNGYILNRGNAGVRIVLQGEADQINIFVKEIQIEKPMISYIENFEVKEISDDEIFENLTIKKSEEARGISLTLPPDIAICEKCQKDMRNPTLKKYFNYPFIACAICGPRFTTVKELPYDRERTTMIDFPLCNKANPESCLQEYADFNNRRFHAQTFACSVCGPHYKLYNKSRELVEKDSIIGILEDVANRITDGEIAAIKGIGGVHLVCLSDDDETILKLRRRKGKRKYKPFAVMVPNLKAIEEEFNISNHEIELLTSYRRPIVLLERRDSIKDSIFSLEVAPGLHNVGIMLPYSGIHYLLFDFLDNKPLIYTSGNKSHIPMAIENDIIFNQLKDLVDLFLLHNRPIYQRADDSVLRFHDNKVKLIRRSRGYVPEYLPLPFNVDVPGAIATGPLLAATGAILRYNRVFPTQHIGNVTHLETYNFLKNALLHMKSLLKIQDNEIKFIACDAHPTFITTQLGKELSEQYNAPLYPIQHHYAHVLGLMAENRIQYDEKIIGISTDGVGYGDDGQIWGGEVLLCSYRDYKRLGCLAYQPMIGGDRCTKYPARMAASILLNTLGIERAKTYFDKLKILNDLEYAEKELEIIISQFTKMDEKHIPLTSSTGRIFDTVSYLMGACKLKTYRGEPAMRLEGLARKGDPKNVALEIECNNTINTSKLILDIIDLLDDPKNKKEDIASKFQIELGKAFAKLAISSAESYGLKKIGLTGGVAYNYSFSKAIRKYITLRGFEFLEHNIIPPGDAGISTGQLIGGLFNYIKNN
ncbi:MAG: carbamoyltransferase HypF [Candidatus Hodarchaeota archaeon]